MLAAPPTSPSLDAVLAAQDWADLSRRLTRYAHVRLRKTSRATAEELAQQAIVQLLDPAYATWDRERHPDVYDCLGHLVNGLVANHFRLLARRGAHVRLRDDEGTDDDEAVTGADPTSEDEAPPPPIDAAHPVDWRTAEDLLASNETPSAEAVMAALRARLEGDALCLALLDRMKIRGARAADHAEALGVAVSEVYRARQRLMHHARAVARDLARGGES